MLCLLTALVLFAISILVAYGIYRFLFDPHSDLAAAQAVITGRSHASFLAESTTG